MKDRPIIIGIGELLWDMLPYGRKAGGAPINFVYHASKLGADAYAVSAVGNDEAGDDIMKEIEKIGINHIIADLDYPTGTVLVDLKYGIPDYTIVEDVAWDYIPLNDSIKALAEIADAICFGTLAQRSEVSRNTIQTILSLVPEHAYRIYDINLRQHFFSKEIIEESLKKCNILKINVEELNVVKDLFDMRDLDEMGSCKRFVEIFKLEYMILRAGADYSLICTPDTFSYLRTPKVEVVDTVGAGDSFTGAFIAAILDGETLKKAHQAAVEISAFVCTKPGAWVD